MIRLVVALFLAGAGLAGQDPAAAAGDAESWLSYGRDYSGTRFVPEDQINRGNVERLRVEWIHQNGWSGSTQATPIVHDGVMYLTGTGNAAAALDLRSGRPLWTHSEPAPKGAQGCCGQPNRGFAIRDGRLFKVDFEGELKALDAKTGRVLWRTELADYRDGYSATSAPLVVGRQVITGIAGAEFGTRDFIDSYDATTGERLWRFWTIPGEGEPGNETWGPGDAWKRGGGSTWITGTYDPELNLIYWGTGNPGPDMDGDVRPGDNLYTCSIVALDADTGELRWHFQFTPHDVHDWDAVADPVLVDLRIDGVAVPAVIQANRNGHFYALDRRDGKFLLAKPYTEVDWLTGFTEEGRPLLAEGKGPSAEGTVACPGLGGGHNWQPTAYSPSAGLYYFPTTDGCQIYYRTTQGYLEGQWYMASTVGGIAGGEPTGAIVGLDPSTGETKWRFEMVSRPSAGVLATGGGLVFSGDAEGYLFALDDRTGEPLWNLQSGARVASAPISYLLDGKQKIAVSAGSTLVVLGLPD